MSTANRLTRAMDHINVRLNYTAPTQSKTAPLGLLAWYLSQINPVAGHPDTAGQPLIRSAQTCPDHRD